MQKFVKKRWGRAGEWLKGEKMKRAKILVLVVYTSAIVWLIVNISTSM